MNDETMNNLERGLLRLRPVELSAGLKGRLADEPLTVGDRVLASFAGVGAVAACVIVAVGVMQAMVATPRALSAQEIAASQQIVAEYSRILAVSDWRK